MKNMSALHLASGSMLLVPTCFRFFTIDSIYGSLLNTVSPEKSWMKFFCCFCTLVSDFHSVQIRNGLMSYCEQIYQ